MLDALFGDPSQISGPEMEWSNVEDDRKRQHAVGEQQTGLNADILRRARGEGPSLADAQMQQGMQQSAAMQQGAAASARGGALSQLLAQRGAQQQGAQTQAQLTGAAGVARIQEQQQAQQLAQQGLSQQRGQDIGAMGQEGNLQLGIGGLQNQTQQNQAQQAQQIRQGNQQMIAGGAGAAMGMMSDVRAKQDIRRPTDSEMQDLLEHSDPHKYHYIGEQGPEHLGVMAQDLEHSALGKTLVARDAETGMKAIDLHRAVSALLAMVGDLHDRVKSVENKR